MTQLRQLTLPLTPLLRPGQTFPQTSKRLRPEDSLNLKEMSEQLAPSILKTVDVKGSPWSIISVYSPYSADVHVMVMETDACRYLPGPEYVPADEGEKVMEIFTAVLDYIRKRDVNDTVHFGYNWSPRSWGKYEEKGGFQSIPTKWHAMLWGWPSFPEPGSKKGPADWICCEQLGRQARRIFCENDYILPFSEMIATALYDAFGKSEYPAAILAGNWQTEAGSLVLPVRRSVFQMISEKGFFTHFLKPLASCLNRLMAALTESMTNWNCSKTDQLLALVEKGPLSEAQISALRKAPDLRTYDEAAALFKANHFPLTLLDALYPAVKRRCEETSDPAEWWRKGFGYALVFSMDKKDDTGKISLMPGVYTGPGGVVEAQGVVLRRPLDRSLSTDELRKRSDVLWELANFLKIS